MQYILTANEGDSRDYDGYSEEERLEDVTLDPTAFPNAATLQQEENGGRIKITNSMGDTDGDGDYDAIYTYGARSCSIWDASANLVFDSGDEFEQIIAMEDPSNFNSTNDDNDSFDNRSDDKGPEPEAIEVAEIDGKFYAFIGLERMGGIMAYDISDPMAPVFLDYVNNRNFSVEADASGASDLGIEDIKFVSADQSPDGKNYLLTSNEVSGTVSAFEISGLGVGANVLPELIDWALHPNPANTVLYSNFESDFKVFNLQGQMVQVYFAANKMDFSSLAPGSYLVLNAKGEAMKIIKK